MTRLSPTIAFLTFGIFAFGQEPITRANFNPEDSYLYQRGKASYVHPQGYPVTVVVVSSKSTGYLYTVAIRSEDAAGLTERQEVVIFPTRLP